jgi:hypothetical protein
MNVSSIVTGSKYWPSASHTHTTPSMIAMITEAIAVTTEFIAPPIAEIIEPCGISAIIGCESDKSKCSPFYLSFSGPGHRVYIRLGAMTSSSSPAP